MENLSKQPKKIIRTQEQLLNYIVELEKIKARQEQAIEYYKIKQQAFYQLKNSIRDLNPNKEIKELIDQWENWNYNHTIKG